MVVVRFRLDVDYDLLRRRRSWNERWGGVAGPARVAVEWLGLERAARCLVGRRTCC